MKGQKINLNKKIQFKDLSEGKWGSIWADNEGFVSIQFLNTTMMLDLEEWEDFKKMVSKARM